MEAAGAQQHMICLHGADINTVTDFKQVMAYVEARDPACIIVSALGQTAQWLQPMASEPMGLDAMLQPVVAWHQHIATRLLSAPEDYLHYLASCVESIQVDCKHHGEDNVALPCVGEYLASRLVAEYLNECGVSDWDPFERIYLANNGLSPVVDWHRSNQQQPPCSGRIVVPARVITTAGNQRYYLSQSGFTATAAVMMRWFELQQVILVSQQQGIFDADPECVPEARLITNLGLNEAVEWAHWGQGLLCAEALQLLNWDRGSIGYYSTATQRAGSCIEWQPTPPQLEQTPSSYQVRGISAKSDLVALQFGLMPGGGGFGKLLSLFEAQGITPLMVSHSSGQDSTVLIAASQWDQAEQALQNHENNTQIHGFMDLQVHHDCAALAIIGEGMRGQSGIIASVCQSLTNANISLRMIGQGITECSVLLVIAADAYAKAMRVVHAALGLSTQRIQVALIGPGNVGRHLLKLLFEQSAITPSSRFWVTAICQSQSMVLDETGFTSEDDVERARTTYAVPSDLIRLASWLKANNRSHTLVVDCSSSEAVVDSYATFMAHGCHLVTPNKRAMSGDWQRYQAILNAADLAKVAFHRETNVCAGLPILTTLQDLCASGDRIFSIQGVFSGTLAYLCDELCQGKVFSSVVHAAHAQGLTEPDPRDDLSGLDVARKCVCLARAWGFNIGLDDVDLEPMMAASWFELSEAEFWEQLPQLDREFSVLVEHHRGHRQRLAYLGCIDNHGRISVKLTSIGEDNLFYSLHGTDNQVVFHTQRYDTRPLVVQGPGAGVAVTAAGILADMLRLTAVPWGNSG